MRLPPLFPAAAALALSFLSLPLAADEFPAVVNSQPLGESPGTPAEDAAAIRVPPGFQAKLFAGEPDVSQPIAFDTDDRGRVWVAECYTYAERGYTDAMRDRLVILEDADNDGAFDRRTVFWDRGRRLSSVTWGFGGAWILNDGKLQLLPDRDGDDQVDGPAEDHLIGFDIEHSNHNIVNGLLWGPDGWLYGRHGILGTSFVGIPGTPPERRTPLNCGIWRYHPTRRAFEVLSHGTTNPWGMDYNDMGELFFTNNVTGHLWHVVPGTHFTRMYGEDLNPNLYQLIEQTADHFHWDTGQKWTDSREGKGKHGELGGGHSHVGGMIYLGGRWPERYRNQIFMCNTHGRRVNVNSLHREGCSYVGRRQDDFLFAGTPWFRGIDLKAGPDGDVFLSDWTDLGECHDHDGVHRTSGRIYKVTFGAPQVGFDALAQPLAERSDLELVELQWHSNDWWVRRARRLLQERAAAGSDLTAARKVLNAAALAGEGADARPPRERLRALWALHVTGGAATELLETLADDADESLRCWAIRLQLDAAPAGEGGRRLPEATWEAWRRAAAGDSSGLVRLYLASALQQLAPRQRWGLADLLAAHQEDGDDRVQPLLIWYGLEGAVLPQPPAAPPGAVAEAAAADKAPADEAPSDEAPAGEAAAEESEAFDSLERAVALLSATPMRSLRRHLARRIAGAIESHPAAVEQLVRAASASDAPRQLDILEGMAAAFRGWRRAAAPPSWAALAADLSSGPVELRQLAQELSVVFGDGRALKDLFQTAQDSGRDTSERRNALRVLIESRADGLAPVLQSLLQDRNLADVAADGLAAYDDPHSARRLIEQYKNLRGTAPGLAIATLVSRTEYAAELLDAVERDAIPKSDLTAVHARQIAALNDPKLNRKLEEVWGSVRSTPGEKLELVARWKRELTPESLLQADLRAGRELFLKQCASCHKLFNEGKSIGPDLTGANRDNLDYLLLNLADPSALVAAQFRMSTLRLSDGRVVSGVVVREAGPTVVVQTPKEELTIRRDEIEARQESPTSLMPDGIWKPLSDAQLRDLIAYLKRTEPLPPADRGGP